MNRRRQTFFAAPAPLLVGLVALCLAPAGAREPAIGGWRADLDGLYQGLVGRHADLDHFLSAEELAQAIAALRGRLASLQPHERIVAMQGLVARIGDAHTYLDLPAGEHPLAFRQLPLRFGLFEDGLFVTQTTAPHRSLAGRRVIRLGTLDAAQAIARAEAFVSHDNPSSARFLAARRLALAEVLHGLGVSAHPDRVQIGTEAAAGRVESVEVVALERGASPQWIDPRDPGRLKASLYWRDPDSPFWLENLAEEGTIYLQLNRTTFEAGQVEKLVADLSARISATENPRLILDVRRNIGGNWREAIPLIRGALQAGDRFEPGNLFILIGRASISATVVLVQEIQRYSDAILIGEPTGSRPNQFGDNAPAIRLPHTGLELFVSSAFYQTAGPYAFRPWVAPDLFVPPTAAAYFAVLDPAIEAARAYRLETPVGRRMEDAIARRAFDEAVEIYRSFCADPIRRYVESERTARLAGSNALEAGHPEAALSLHRLNVRRYPLRARPLAMLAAAEIAAGQAELGQQSVRRARALVAADPSLTRRLKERVLAFLADLEGDQAED